VAGRVIHRHKPYVCANEFGTCRTPHHFVMQPSRVPPLHEAAATNPVFLQCAVHITDRSTTKEKAAMPESVRQCGFGFCRRLSAYLFESASHYF
jgi:hypothetical protein